jgi:hypothetical protein
MTLTKFPSRSVTVNILILCRKESVTDVTPQVVRACYSGRKITESLGNVTVRREKIWEEQGGSAMASTVCVGMYSITENFYYSQLSSVAILLQPEPVSYRIIQGKDFVLTLCAIVLQSSLPSYLSTSNGQRSSQLFCVHYTHCCCPAQ